MEEGQLTDRAVVVRKDLPEPPPVVVPKLKASPPVNVESVSPSYKTVNGVDEYVIGPGDVLSIVLWKGFDKDITDVTVRPSGEISYLFLEDQRVGGMTPSEVDALLTEKLAAFIKDPRIDVLIKDYGSKRVSLFGEISVLSGRTLSGPNIYPLKGRTTLIDLILEAGGQTDKADLSGVQLFRGGKMYRLNLVNALYRGDVSQNVILENSDRIVVPTLADLKEKRVLVFGEAVSPGVYTFSKEARVVDAILKAGGQTRGAKAEKIAVIRGNPQSPTVYPINLKDIILRADLRQNILLEDGDIVFIPSTTIERVSDFVSNVTPVLTFLLYPATYRDLYTTGGGLRLDTGLPPTGVPSAEVTILPTGAPSTPGVSTPSAPGIPTSP